MALPSFKKDGTEGTATLAITLEDRILLFPGCIVEKDDNFDNFIPNSIKQPADMKKFKDAKYFFYTCDPDSKVQEAIIKTTSCTVTCHRFLKQSKPKSCKLEWLPKNNNFAKVQEHIFLPCDSKNFNKCKFLKDYSKKILVAQDLTQVIHVLSYEGGNKSSPKFIPLKLNRKSSNVYGINAECYKMLEDAGPVLLQDGKTVVGSLKKKENDEISISIFRIMNQEMTSTSCTDEESPGAGTGDTTGTQTPVPGDGTEQTVGTQTPVPGDGTGQTTGSGRVLDPPNPPGDNQQSDDQDDQDDQDDRSSDNSDGVPGGVEQQDAPPHNARYSIEEQGDLPGITRKNLIPRARGSSTMPNDQPDLPNGYSLDDVISKDDLKYRRCLLYIAENLTDDQWLRVGRNLDIEPPVLSNIRTDYTRNKERSYQMLVKWLDSSYQPKLQILLQALTNVGQQQLVDKIPDDVLRENVQMLGGKPVTDPLFRDIADDIKDEWRFLGRYLGLPENAIHHINHNNSTLYEQAIQMLFEWRNRNGRNATSRVLIRALRDVDKVAVAWKVETWERL